MYIPTRIVTKPAVEPVTLDEIKTHLRGISHTDHDDMLTGLIKSARENIEAMTGRALVQRTMAAMFQAWPDDGVFELPSAPLRSVSSVNYTDTDGTEYTFQADYYSVDTDSEPGRVVLGYSKIWPSVTLYAPDYPIVVSYTAGYAPSGEDLTANIPENIKTAIKFMVDMSYSQPPADYVEILKRAIDSLLAPYRIWGF